MEGISPDGAIPKGQPETILVGRIRDKGALSGIMNTLYKFQNVGGIPGTESPWAFPIVSLVLVVIALGLVWIFRRIKWL